MKDSQLNEILFDLYMIDEDLRSYEKELKDIILEINYSRPDTEFDENFKQNLKEEILLKIQSFKRDNLNRKINLSSDLPKESNLLIFMKKINYILGGASVSTIAILVAAYFMISSGQISFGNKTNSTNKINNTNSNQTTTTQSNNTKNTTTDLIAKVDDKLVVKSVGGNAFGAMSILSPDPVDGSSTESSQTVASINSSTSSSSTTPTTSTTNSPMIASPSSVLKTGSLMMPYNPIYYTYIYTDSKDKLTYDTTDLNVLKRVSLNATDFNPGIINIGSVNLSSFKNLTLNNIALDENADNGYSIYFNFTDGSLSINKNWQKWPNIDYNKKLQISDIPSDDSLIKTSNDFITKYGIDVKNYGKPEVIDDWKTYYNQSTDKENYYLPTSISVIYPLIINGKEVYESYGNKIGMTVNIDTISNQVSGLYGLQSQKYESSKYDLETNTDRLLEVIKIGGEVSPYRYMTVTNNSGTDSTPKEATLNVKNPNIVYVRSYKYENNTSYELFIPAMILDIDNTSNTSKDNTVVYKKNIIIPLTKDSIDEIIKNNTDQKNNTTTPQPPVGIQPMMKTVK